MKLDSFIPKEIESLLNRTKFKKEDTKTQEQEESKTNTRTFNIREVNNGSNK